MQELHPHRREQDQVHHPVRARVRKRIEHDIAEHAIDDGDGADAERQRQRGHNREAARSRQRANAVANVAPQIVFGKLLGGGSGNADADRQMTSFRPGPGTMMIHIACDRLPDWTASEELQRFAYVHLAPSLDMMGRAYYEALAGLLPGEPVLVVGQPTAIDPSRAPEDRSGSG